MKPVEGLTATVYRDAPFWSSGAESGRRGGSTRGCGAARAVCRCGAATHAEHTTSAPVYVTFSPDGNARLQHVLDPINTTVDTRPSAPASLIMFT